MPKKAKIEEQARPDYRRMAEGMKVASDPTRLCILATLAVSERNVQELCGDVGTTSQPAVSHHLALLRYGRMVEPRRSGKFNFYNITDRGRAFIVAAQSLAE
jgi:DNA-binding transcriptional ArsR family regulator